MAEKMGGPLMPVGRSFLLDFGPLQFFVDSLVGGECMNPHLILQIGKLRLLGVKEVTHSYKLW